jgi:hypothetical protein
MKRQPEDGKKSASRNCILNVFQTVSIVQYIVFIKAFNTVQMQTVKQTKIIREWKYCKRSQNALQ